MSDQLPLTPAAVPAGPVRFTAADGEAWRVERWSELAAEFGGLRVEELPRLPEVGQRLAPEDGGRAWRIVRRLFGVRPVVPPAGANPEDLRGWSRVELEEGLGLTRKQLQAELDAFRGALRSGRDVAEEATRAAAAVQERARTERAEAFAATGGELPLTTDVAAAEKVLALRGIPLKWFNLEDRDPESNLTEKLWAASRITELAKLFEHGPTKELARRLVLCELKLRRRDEVVLGTAELEGKGKAARNEWIAAMTADDEEFRKLMAQIQDLAPWFFAMGNALNAKGAFAEWVRGMQEFYGQGKTDWLQAGARMTDALVRVGTADGYLTADELQTQVRPNVEVPEPQYRLSLALWAGMVRQHLWDPKWKPEVNQRLLACLDAGFRQGFMEAYKKEGLVIPDLLKEGPEGEHLPLVD
jgi:hypothetical protein